MNDTAQRELELEENALKQIAQAGFDVDAVQAYRDYCGVSYTPLYSVNADGEVIEEWLLKGAFIVDSNFGTLGWDTDEVMQIELNIRYDWAFLSY